MNVASTPAQRIVLAAELDLMEHTDSDSTRDIRLFAAHAAACAAAACSVIKGAGLPAGVEVRISDQLHDDDMQFFRRNKNRTHGIRPTSAGEFLLTLPGAEAATHALVRQVQPGVRILCPLRLVTRVAAGLIDELDAIDCDIVLSTLFDSVCGASSIGVDIEGLVAAAQQFARFANAAYAISPERRPS